jgi:pyruvate/2-oxoglutarate dehydrogenase complex dihydrolipoamide acyltransferase (E2) component
VAVSVAVPNLGEEMAGGLVAEWYIADGASVAEGDAVCRVECSWVAFDVEAEGPGLLRHRKPVGSIEHPGVILGLILAPDEAIPSEPTLVPEPPLEPVKANIAPEPNEPESEPLPEFEEALVEAVVVPFPRRFTQPQTEWEQVPGDAVNFDSSLFGGREAERAAALEQPGGDIPGLPLWEPDDVVAEIEDSGVEARFSRISREAAASAQILNMTVLLDMTEAARMRSVCQREWEADGLVPLMEDVLLRGIAHSITEHVDDAATAGLLIAGMESDVAVALNEPAARAFKTVVQERVDGGNSSFEAADWILVSVAAAGVTSATPRLDGARTVAFACGHIDDADKLILTMAYDPARMGEGAAARLLARVREVVQAPYAMLV